MTDRPIIFSAPMVCALLDGMKTQTRRVLRVQPPNRLGWKVADQDEDSVMWMSDDGTHCACRLPYAPGDRLWVREAWAKVGDFEDDIHACPDLRIHAYYRADAVDPERQRWRSPIHMPRWASRLTLTVTDVHVQRLQEISEADARAEGVSDEWDNPERYGQSEPYRYGFSALWNSIHGPDAWEANPWVVALTFTVANANIDEVPT